MTNAENRVTVWMSDSLAEAMDDSIDWRYGSRSQYVREAVQFRQVLEGELDRQGLDLPAEDDDRERLLRSLALAAIDAHRGEIPTIEEIEAQRPEDADSPV